MKPFIFLIVLFIIPISLIAEENPFSGEVYEINYNPSEKGILNNSDSISVVYVFDYWGTKGTYSGGANALYQNVLEPDSGRAIYAKMVKRDNHWVASIDIPKTASILSYYFTDGKIIEDNNFKTYVHYIYGKDKKPVKSARFRNIDFLVLAGKSEADQISELKKEILAYPDNFMAYVPLWRMKFKSAKDFKDLFRLQEEFEKQFADLKNILGESDSLLLAEVSIYYNWTPNLGRLLRNESDKISSIMIPKIERIPKEKRSIWIQEYYNHAIRYKRGKEISANIKGKPAPDFSFTSLDNKKQNLSDYRGKIILLDFWGTWCGPCVAEIPNLIKAYNKYNSLGFEIISISSDKRSRKYNVFEFKKFIEDKGMQWTQVVDDDKLSIHDKYGVIKWPSLYLIDKNGIIVKVDEGLRGRSLSKTISELL